MGFTLLEVGLPKAETKGTGERKKPMVDYEKIISAKVFQQLTRRGLGPLRPNHSDFESYCKSISKKHDFQTLRRTYEVEHTDDFGKLFFANHHLIKIQTMLKTHLARAIQDIPMIVIYSNSMNDVRYMSGITEVIDERVQPAIKALEGFSSNPNDLLNEYQSIVHKFNSTVEHIKCSTPKGKGYCKVIRKQLIPEYITFLKAIIEFIDKTITNYQL